MTSVEDTAPAPAPLGPPQVLACVNRASRSFVAIQAPSAIAGALCHLDCTVGASVDAGTHAIVVGRVEARWDLLARHGY